MQKTAAARSRGAGAIAALWIAAWALASATPALAGPARIALIIDDLGNGLASGRRAASLPGPVAMAILPYTPHGRAIAGDARAAGKEVLLHLPLEPADYMGALGPGEISMESSRPDVARVLAQDLASVPHVVGVSTHMGSLLTRHPGHMGWLMEAISTRGGLFFVDSYTTPRSIALRMARERGLPAARRDVFLDDDADPSAIAAAFAQLKAVARQRGSALGIGHPYHETLDFLEQALPALRHEGFEIVPVLRVLQYGAGSEL